MISNIFGTFTYRNLLEMMPNFDLKVETSNVTLSSSGGDDLGCFNHGNAGYQEAAYPDAPPWTSIRFPSFCWGCTLPATNISNIENRPLDKEIPIENHHF